MTVTSLRRVAPEKIIRMRRLLLQAAKDLEKGIEPPCLDPSLPYDRVGTPDKVLLPGEDWTVLGSENDPIMNALLAGAPPPTKVDPNHMMMQVPAPRAS